MMKTPGVNVRQHFLFNKLTTKTALAKNMTLKMLNRKSDHKKFGGITFAVVKTTRMEILTAKNAAAMH